MWYHNMPIRNLRSSNSLLLSSLSAKTNFGLHAFPSVAPIIWNKLPLDIKTAPSIASFKALLETHYFQHTSWLVTWPHASDSLTTLRLVCTLYNINCYCHCHNPSFHLFKYFLNVLTNSEATTSSGSSFNSLIIPWLKNIALCYFYIVFFSDFCELLVSMCYALIYEKLGLRIHII